MDLIAKLNAALGETNVLTGNATERFSHDWTHSYTGAPLAVARPANTEEVSLCVKAAAEADVSIVPVGGNTGLAGGTHGPGALMISMERMNRIEEIRPSARIAIVQSGVILSQLHDAVEEHGLSFPLTFGARGSAMIGGNLSTNAGGSNVLRYGNTRSQCLGLEVVLASGEILNLMSELHKDNSGYDLKDLFIGAEGTLGLITRAVVRLQPTPAAYATAMVATPDLPSALKLLNNLQKSSGGAVEAFEYMPKGYMNAWQETFPDQRPPFAEQHDVNILVEIGASAARDAVPNADGTLPIANLLEESLGSLFEDGVVLDAVVAKSNGQRQEMWARREAAAEVSLGRGPIINNDVALPLDKVDTFLTKVTKRLDQIDPDLECIVVAHLGDGNVHLTVRPAAMTDQLKSAVMEAVEDEVLALGGSFSAEHGIGLSKLPSMERRKDANALATMRAIKAALDPSNRLNPGKVIPT